MLRTRLHEITEIRDVSSHRALIESVRQSAPHTIPGMPIELAEELLEHLTRSLTGKDRIAGPSLTDVDN